MKQYLLLFLVPLLAAGCGLFGSESKVPLSELPPQVLSAAKGAAPGILFDEIELETEDGVSVYEFDGVAGGERYEIVVSAAGEVLEVERKGTD